MESRYEKNPFLKNENAKIIWLKIKQKENQSYFDAHFDWIAD